MVKAANSTCDDMKEGKFWSRSLFWAPLALATTQHDQQGEGLADVWKRQTYRDIYGSVCGYHIL